MAESRNEIAFYLNRARLLAGQDRFDEARDALNNAYKFASSDEVLQVEEAERQIEQQRGQRIQELADTLADLLNTPVDQLTPEKLARGEETLARLRVIHPDPAEV
ncbi:MAG: hypothetical protein ACPL7K_07965, partial [Armatimonadota bacterium]